jgi:anhydro-N-acetylmuramic acid kinase
MQSLNRNLKRLFSIAQKEEKLGIGLMSGTSLDGLDIALCRFKSHGKQTAYELLEYRTQAYDTGFKEDIQSIFSKKTISLEKLCLMNAQIGNKHAEYILESLQSWKISPEKIDYIASHGQTIYHAPKSFHQQEGFPNATLQIGDGDHIAHKTKILTIADFRQKDIAAGGEGAPLALYGDIILGSKSGENRLLLNIGGISNFTYLPGNHDTDEILCTDVGPGNTLTDALCRKLYGLAYDENGHIAFSGKANLDLLKALLNHPFYQLPMPRTTGPELFSLDYVDSAQQQSNTTGIAKEDLISTVSYLTASVIAQTILHNFKDRALSVYISGGGAKNTYIVQAIKQLLPELNIHNSSQLGIDPDAKEAILFALLGNEALSGEPLKINGRQSVLMGKFCFPY